MITCEYCGVRNNDDIGSCVKCGAPLPEIIIKTDPFENEKNELLCAIDVGNYILSNELLNPGSELRRHELRALIKTGIFDAENETTTEHDVKLWSRRFMKDNTEVILTYCQIEATYYYEDSLYCQMAYDKSRHDEARYG